MKDFTAEEDFESAEELRIMIMKSGKAKAGKPVMIRISTIKEIIQA